MVSPINQRFGLPPNEKRKFNVRGRKAQKELTIFAVNQIKSDVINTGSSERVFQSIT